MNKNILLGLLGVLFFANTTSAQLNQTFSRIFDRVLNEDLKLQTSSS